jgi:hypothetical protein
VQGFRNNFKLAIDYGVAGADIMVEFPRAESFLKTTWMRFRLLPRDLVEKITDRNTGSKRRRYILRKLFLLAVALGLKNPG